MKLAVHEPAIPELVYKDHRIFIISVGKGWRAMIYPPGSSVALPESPVTLEQCPKATIIADAKLIVDARCTPNSL